MKTHTTNYANAFIEVAEDSQAGTGTVPPEKAVPSIAWMQCIHHDGQARVAIYPVESMEYARLKADKSLKHLKAMRSKR